MKESQILQCYDWLSPLAKKDGLEFDLHGFSLGKTEIVCQKKNLEQCSYSESQHLNLRVLQGKKSGSSYTKELSKKHLEDCYRRALDGLRFSDQEEKGELSPKVAYEDFSKFYSEDLEKMPMEEKIQKAEEISKACLDFDSRFQSVFSSFSDGHRQGFFINSLGAKSFYKFNGLSVGCQALAVQGESRAQGFMEAYRRSCKGIDFSKIGSSAADKSLKKLNYGIPETKRYPVLFKPGTGAFFLDQLADLLNGKMVYQGLSLFKESIGKKLFSSSFSFYDDPLALWASRSRPFDGEGFAMEKTSLVKEGVLENYLTSSFFAKALKAPHTKKAGWSEEGRLGIARTNLVMEEGSDSFESMLEAFPQVILIDNLKGGHAGYNPISGDFSLESEGFLWEKGEGRPLCQFTVSGNIRDLFANVLKIGSESEICYGSVKSPPFLVPDLMIAGK